MKFSSVNQRIWHADAEQASSIMNRVLLELGVREDNHHVGSGLGGNSLQLLMLMDMKHHLDNSDGIYIYADGRAMWGLSALLKNKMADIRAKLDQAFIKVPEDRKLLAMAQHITANNSHTLVDYLNHSSNYKFELDVLGKIHRREPVDLQQLPVHSHMMIALFICSALAAELDATKNSNQLTPELDKKIEYTGNIMKDFSLEVILFSVRQAINISRLDST